MALIQKDIPAPALQRSSKTDDLQNSEAEKIALAADADAQDEALWESKFTASQDTLAHLAAQARAHRSAGRTKKIGS